ncbi:hypothetical protein FN846DRAFT_127125 [Sphaerosporella brunnea]|uniref:Uncharacterized protein n=1 Tax=Sphaerosporella brunnea TaxID=1250544 RepID=A0A5J5ER70_9PEZI|nr:hypothetical protein FN846DRAFT_127125 [Sphaerosporella brunnea]
MHPKRGAVQLETMLWHGESQGSTPDRCFELDEGGKQKVTSNQPTPCAHRTLSDDNAQTINQPLNSSVCSSFGSSDPTNQQLIPASQSLCMRVWPPSILNDPCCRIGPPPPMIWRRRIAACCCCDSRTQAATDNFQGLARPASPHQFQKQSEISRSRKASSWGGMQPILFDFLRCHSESLDCYPVSTRLSEKLNKGHPMGAYLVGSVLGPALLPMLLAAMAVEVWLRGRPARMG